MWKSVRLLDLIVSSTFGRPSATCTHHSEVEFDKYTQDDLSESSSISFLALDESVKVFLIVEKIKGEIYQNRRFSIPLAEALSSQLREWSARLPNKLQEFTATQEHSDSQGELLAKSSVAFSYYYAMILLMRPFLVVHIKSRLKLMDSGFLGQCHDSSAARKVMKFAHACLDSAIYMLELMSKLLGSGSLFKNMPIMM